MNHTLPNIDTRKNTRMKFNESGDPIVQGAINDLIAFRQKGSTFDYTLQERAYLDVNVKDFGAVGDGKADDTQAFLNALQSANYITIPTGTYNIIGEFRLRKGTILSFQNCVINIDVSGENGRGFYFAEGNAIITGNATINATATILGSDGARNGVFSIGSDFYVTQDPQPIRNCIIDGNFIVNLNGTQNIKAVGVYGYCEDIKVSGIKTTGMGNYLFACHWVGNGTDTTLPTKTWHPHRIEFNNCIAFDNGSNKALRGFTVSACGHVVFNNCQCINLATLGFNLFAGDYGYTYAQNLTNINNYDIHLNDCSTNGISCAMSATGITGGKNGSSSWEGAYNNANLTITNFLAQMLTGTDILDIAIQQIATVNATNFRLYEADAPLLLKTLTNTKSSLYLTSIANGCLQGEIRTNVGVLIRDCNDINYNVNTTLSPSTPNTTSGCITSSALSFDTTNTIAVNIGDTSIAIANATDVLGVGGFVRYNDGVKNYDIETMSSTYVGGNQTIKIKPSPIAIPINSKVTLIQTNRQISIGSCVLQGARSLIRLTGTSTAKSRNITCTNTRFLRSGVACVDALVVDGLTLIGTYHNNAGQTSTTQGSSCIALGADAENIVISDCRFGSSNNVRYVILCDDASNKTVITSNIFLSYNGSATNPACIYKKDAKNTKITDSNIYADNLTPLYPKV